MPTWNLEIPGSEVRVGDVLYEYEAHGWRVYHDGPLTVTQTTASEIWGVGSYGIDELISDGTYRTRGMKRVLRAQDELEGYITSTELADGDRILKCALIIPGGRISHADWTSSNVVIGTPNYTLAIIQDNYPPTTFRFKVLDRVPVLAPVLCSCGRKVSGAMMAIGARHLCP